MHNKCIRFPYAHRCFYGLSRNCGSELHETVQLSLKHDFDVISSEFHAYPIQTLTYIADGGIGYNRWTIKADEVYMANKGWNFIFTPIDEITFRVNTDSGRGSIQKLKFQPSNFAKGHNNIGNASKGFFDDSKSNFVESKLGPRTILTAMWQRW